MITTLFSLVSLMNADRGAARGHYRKPKLINSETGGKRENVRLCSLMFAYVRLTGEKILRALRAATGEWRRVGWQTVQRLGLGIVADVATVLLSVDCYPSSAVLAAFVAFGRGPNNAVPRRTTVAPSSIATSKSPLMPMLNSGSDAPSRSSQRCFNSCNWRKIGRTFSGSGDQGAMVIRPWISSRASALIASNSASNCSGRYPNLLASPARLTSSKIGIGLADFSAHLSISRASARLSTLSIISNHWTASRHLLDWRCPIIRQRNRLGHKGIFALASCTLFSPNNLWPRSAAARTTSGGQPLVTANNRTDDGSRPARAHAASMRCRTALKFAAKSMRRKNRADPAENKPAQHRQHDRFHPSGPCTAPVSPITWRVSSVAPFRMSLAGRLDIHLPAPLPSGSTGTCR